MTPEQIDNAAKKYLELCGFTSTNNKDKLEGAKNIIRQSLKELKVQAIIHALKNDK